MIVFERRFNRMFLNRIKDAIERYDMIRENDRVAVGLSGGKDSIFLLYALILVRDTSYKKFDIMGINIDLGFGMDMSPLREFLRENNIPYVCEKTDIGDVIFKDRREKNPCALCSNLRKGALYRVAIREGANIVALGHNSDDAAETFFMNMLSVGKLGTFRPLMNLENKGISVIRPLVYIREDEIKRMVSSFNLPVIKSACPAAGKTRRQEMKELIESLRSKYPDINEKMITAFENVDFLKMWRQRNE